MAGPLKPFTIDDEVMGRIRPMQHRDAARVAELHQAAMGNSLWAKLGHRFLTELYRGLIDNPRFIAFVYIEDGEVGGFIAGSTDAELMMREVFQRRWLVLGVTSLPNALKPAVVKHLVQTARYFDASGADVRAESLFCSFVPNLRGKRVSGHINKVLFDDLLARGHKAVKITTEVDNEGANRQLQSWGFEDKGHFMFYGKNMVTYVLDLERCERVQPVLRHPAV